MPEFFCELFCEEIPARLQARAADDFARLVGEALAPVAPTDMQVFYGPRRLALRAQVAGEVASAVSQERGPRIAAPEAALAGFLRKHGAAREDLRQEGDFWVLQKTSVAQEASALIASVMPGLLRRFPWPKSMRWGGTSAFTWIRPLRRIICQLDGVLVPFSLATQDDDGHGLAAGNLTEGHRVHGKNPFPVTGFSDWLGQLKAQCVLVDAADRAAAIRAGIAQQAAAHCVTVLEDAGLVEEVAGLVEWPVPLIGRIDAGFMDLPAEVMQVSMRVNQRYFATRDAAGRPAPYFVFAANIAAPDGGAAIINGNERVLRARFSDARHFWDLDRTVKLADRVADLDRIIFQAELGTQGARVQRIVALAQLIAPLVGADAGLAQRAALLAKADLTTGMVGEFPELQGVMGGYYAAHDGEAAEVCAAVRDHYAPKGAGDAVPCAPVTIAVALADKLDQLAGFFAIGQKPTGSGDPFALRRAALGVVRMIRENNLRLPLRDILHVAAGSFANSGAALVEDILAFIMDRLRVQLRSEGARYDVLSAVFAAGADDDITRLLARTDAVTEMLKTADGSNLLAAYKRAANILRIEARKDGPHDAAVEWALLTDAAEVSLYQALLSASDAAGLIAAEKFREAMLLLAQLRAPLDAFFEQVTVNAADPALRLNRLRLLSMLRASLTMAAEFSQIESPA